ncbi:hypothetical protein ACF0H5_001497 [Mactra antiquata]
MAHITHVQFFVVIFVSYSGLSLAEEVIKCLKETKEKFQISCPRGHVIYNPLILAGTGKHDSCDFSKSECTGLTSSLKRQTNKCFWKKRCFIRLDKTERIPACSDNVTSSTISYIIIKQKYCIPKRSIVNLCTASPKVLQSNPGIIKSHASYPMSSPKSIKCNLTIPLKSDDTLYIETISLDGRFPPGLSIKPRSQNGWLQGIHTTERVILHGNETKFVMIIADIKRKRHSSGFVIQFAAYRSEYYDALLRWPAKSRPVISELGWLLDVKPVIEQCTAGIQGHMTLTCGADEVIYNPALSLSGQHNVFNPKCSFGKRTKCGGMSAGLLVQTNACYWRQTCDVTWRRSDRIILSREMRCIGIYASSLGLSGHRCVQKSNIIDVCTTVTSKVNLSWGVIRSHSGYPWYFNNDECKRIIMIGRRHAGVLIVQDMNLDPDGRDKFNVQHITKLTTETVMDSKTSKEGTHVIVRGGKLIIHFKPTKSSKSGRGFILIFRPHV